MDRKLITVAVSTALGLPMAAGAVEFSVSGQVNAAAIVVDGGSYDGDVKFKDADSSSTRFRFTGSEDMGNGWAAGVHLEIGRPDDWRTRHANVYLSGEGGKVTLGQASTATDGVAFANLGGASWLGGVTNWCSYHFEGSNPACQSNDGARLRVLRYDTPAIGPLTISTSVSNDDYWDAMAKIAGSFGDAGYDLRIGYIGETEATSDGDAGVVTGGPMMGMEPSMPMRAEETDDHAHEADDHYHVISDPTPAKTEKAGDIVTASAAVGFGQGTSVWVSWSQDENDDDEFQYVALDHSYGAGSVGVYYKQGEKAGHDGSLWGVGFGHDLGAGATAYAGYRMMEEDGKDDIDVFFAGMRVTFN